MNNDSPSVCGCYDCDIAALKAERDQLRETVKRLNRRATQAEAALLPKAAVVGERSIGRALANAAAATWKRRSEGLEAVAKKAEMVCSVVSWQLDNGPFPLGAATLLREVRDEARAALGMDE